MPRKASLPARRRARKKQQRVQKTAKLGSGARFKALKNAIKKSGARNPGAVAAAIGRKKLGSKRMSKLAAKGRKRAVKKRK